MITVKFEIQNLRLCADISGARCFYTFYVSKIESYYFVQKSYKCQYGPLKCARWTVELKIQNLRLFEVSFVWNLNKNHFILMLPQYYRIVLGATFAASYSYSFIKVILFETLLFGILM